jgi:transcriptional regulator with XRE-family HTH domain
MNEPNPVLTEAFNVFKEALGEESESLKDIQDFTGLYKGFKDGKEAQRAISERGLGLPKEPTAEDLAKLYKRLGVPETEEAYEFKTEKLEFPEEFSKSLKKKFKDTNLTPKQAQELVSFIEQAQLKVEEERTSFSEKRKQEALEAKKSLFKDDLEKVENLINVAVAKVFEDKETASAFNETIKSNPKFMQGFKSLAELVAGDNPTGFKASGDKMINADKTLNSFKENREKAEALRKGVPSALEEFNTAFAIKYGNQANKAIM